MAGPLDVGMLAQDVPLLGPDAAQATQAGLTKAGVLCVLCGLPTGKVTPRDEPHPLEYLRVDVTMEEGKIKPTVVTTRLVVCGRAQCDHRPIRMTANAVRPFTGWEFIDPEEEAAAALAEEEGVPAARFRKDEEVEVRKTGQRAVVMSASHHEPVDGFPMGYWQYALSEDGTAAKALDGNPYPEDALDPPAGAGA